MLLVKAKLNTIEVLISKALIYSYINHNEFVSVNAVNNVLRECNDMTKKIKNLRNSVEDTISKQWEPIVSVVRKILLAKIVVLEELDKIV